MQPRPWVPQVKDGKAMLGFARCLEVAEADLSPKERKEGQMKEAGTEEKEKFPINKGLAVFTTVQ